MKLKTLISNVLIFSLLLCFFCLPVFSETIQNENVIIDFKPKNKVLAQEILNRFDEAKDKVTSAYNLDYEPQIQLLVSESSKDFEKMTGINSTAVQAVAIAEQKMIIINTAALHFTNDELLHLLEHEISHLVLGFHIQHDPEHLPRWFNEGISQWVAEGFNELFSATYMNSLQVSFITGNIIPFENLAGNFPPYLSKEFVQAYAQSLSFIQFLIKNYGENKITELIDRLSGNSLFNEAFAQTYGMSLREAETKWGRTGKQQYTLDYYIASNINSLIYAVMTLLVIIAYFSVRRRNKKKKEKLLEADIPFDN